MKKTVIENGPAKFIKGYYIISSTLGNANGDPQQGGKPRLLNSGKAYIWLHSVTRKIRDMVAARGIVFRRVAEKLGIQESEWDKYQIYVTAEKSIPELLREYNQNPKAFKEKYWDFRVFGSGIMGTLEKSDQEMTDGEKINGTENRILQGGVLQIRSAVSIAPTVLVNSPGTRVGEDPTVISERYAVEHALYFGTFLTRADRAALTGATQKDVLLALELLTEIYNCEGGVNLGDTKVKEARYYEMTNGAPVPDTLVDTMKPNVRANIDPNDPRQLTGEECYNFPPPYSSNEQTTVTRLGLNLDLKMTRADGEEVIINPSR